jgi:hypothetical protein
MDFDTIADLALLYIGEEPLNVNDLPLAGSDHVDGSFRYRLIRQFYLPTFLEALSEVPWTCGKRRALLVLEDSGESGISNLSGYGFMYRLPVDCAKPLELQENSYFIIEGHNLLTDIADARLLYISNGKIDLSTLTAEELEARDEKDFREYDLPEMEPKFYEYLEKTIAAKMAMKLSNQPQLYAMLLQSAMLIKEEAAKASRSNAAAKKNGVPWWIGGDEERLPVGSGSPGGMQLAIAKNGKLGLVMGPLNPQAGEIEIAGNIGTMRVVGFDALVRLANTYVFETEQAFNAAEGSIPVGAQVFKLWE